MSKTHRIPPHPDYRDPKKPETWAYYQSFYLGNPKTRLKQTTVMPTDWLPDEVPEVTPEDIEEQRMIWMLEELENQPNKI